MRRGSAPPCVTPRRPVVRVRRGSIGVVGSCRPAIVSRIGRPAIVSCVRWTIIVIVGSCRLVIVSVCPGSIVVVVGRAPVCVIHIVPVCIIHVVYVIPVYVVYVVPVDVIYIVHVCPVHVIYARPVNIVDRGVPVIDRMRRYGSVIVACRYVAIVSAVISVIDDRCASRNVDVSVIDHPAAAAPSAPPAIPAPAPMIPGGNCDAYTESNRQAHA